MAFGPTCMVLTREPALVLGHTTVNAQYSRAPTAGLHQRNCFEEALGVYTYVYASLSFSMFLAATKGN